MSEFYLQSCDLNSKQPRGHLFQISSSIFFVTIVHKFFERMSLIPGGVHLSRKRTQLKEQSLSFFRELIEKVTKKDPIQLFLICSVQIIKVFHIIFVRAISYPLSFSFFSHSISSFNLSPLILSPQSSLYLPIFNTPSLSLLLLYHFFKYFL